VQVRESQIEGVLATYPDITKEVVGVRDDLTLLARQKLLPSGDRLDLLFVSGTRLKLLELKISIFEKQFVDQVVQYKQELVQLQSEDKLVNGCIDAYLLCPSMTTVQKQDCLKRDVYPIEYSPQNVLASFFARLSRQAAFILLKPADHGLWAIHLLNRVLYTMNEAQTKRQLSSKLGLSESTIGSYLRFAEDLRLVERRSKKFVLTDLGKKYVWNRDSRAPGNHISDEQTKILQEFIIKDPFASRVILGIYTIVEVVFILAKNTYPVPLDILHNTFRENSGKSFEWSSLKSALDGTKMYSNYATELGLLGRLGDKFYITPDGIRFILLLQLHKAMQIVDSLGVLG
jgi:hypothetical protein